MKSAGVDAAVAVVEGVVKDVEDSVDIGVAASTMDEMISFSSTVEFE